MSYKISIKADANFFTVGCCEFEHFEDAKAQVGKMIVDLMTSHLEYDFSGSWEAFKSEFPKEVLSIIESFENDGVASAANAAEGYTDGYYYLISGNSITIDENHKCEYAPDYKLGTNMLGMNGDEKEYCFRLWSGAMYGDPQGLTICLEETH